MGYGVMLGTGGTRNLLKYRWRTFSPGCRAGSPMRAGNVLPGPQLPSRQIAVFFASMQTDHAQVREQSLLMQFTETAPQQEIDDSAKGNDGNGNPEAEVQVLEDQPPYQFGSQGKHKALGCCADPDCEEYLAR